MIKKAIGQKTILILIFLVLVLILGGIFLVPGLIYHRNSLDFNINHPEADNPLIIKDGPGILFNGEEQVKLDFGFYNKNEFEVTTKINLRKCVTSYIGSIDCGGGEPYFIFESPEKKVKTGETVFFTTTIWAKCLNASGEEIALPKAEYICVFDAISTKSEVYASTQATIIITE
ncbi:MAG: hypothetical protein ACP5N3_02510 [Candidatus Nanoarchaeia archaeon]